MYGTEGAPAALPPSAPTEEGAAMSPRYVYLLNRLRTRQITMEEATELFSLQQAMLAQERAANRMSREAKSVPVPAAPERNLLGVISTAPEDLLWEGMLLAGPAAGLLAAIMKRSREVMKDGDETSRTSSVPDRNSARR